ITLNVLELLGEGDEFAQARERPAAVTGKGENELASPVGIGADEARDRVQAVAEEVQLDLGLQRLQLRGCGGSRGTGELGELELRRELVAERPEQVDVVVGERRAVRRVRDEDADRAVAQSERDVRRCAERTG